VKKVLKYIIEIPLTVIWFIVTVLYLVVCGELKLEYNVRNLLKRVRENEKKRAEKTKNIK
jgi:hypothetical protein